MSARKGQISRVTMPPPRMDMIPAGESAIPERPLVSALMVVWRGRWIIALGMVLGVIYGIYKVSTFEPVYRSSSTIYLQPPPVVFTMLTNPNDTSGYLYTQCEIIHSTAMLTKALSYKGVAETECLRNSDNPVAYLKNSVFAGPEKEGSLITVWMVSRNADDSATIVNGVVHAYLDYQAEQHQSMASQINKIINDQVAVQESALKDLDGRITEFRKKHYELSLDKGPQTSWSEQKMNEAHAQVNAFGLAVEQAKNFIDDPFQIKHIVDNANKDASMTPDTDPVVDPVLISKMRETQRSLKDLEAGAQRSDYYKTLKLKAQAEDAEFVQAKAEASARYMKYLNAQLSIATQAEDKYKAEVATERAKEYDRNAFQADYDAMLNSKQQTEHARDMLYEKLKTIGDGGGGAITSLTASVLEPARPSQDSEGARRSSTLMMDVIGGIMLGLGGALLLEMMEQRLRSVEEVVKFLAPPVLGSIPHILPTSGPGNKNIMRGSWARYMQLLLTFRGAQHWRTAETLKQRGQVMHLQPRCDVAEAYRSIRTAIFFGLAGQPAKTILVTSPSSGDGKTTLASNLAISIAQTGRRVLLIDADCWHPAQGDVFEIPEGAGLTDVLMEKAAFKDVVKKTDIAGLDVLPCGKIPENPAEMLGGQSWTDLLTFATEHYDQIIIDSPPVVPITDARVLAASCEATILVLRAEKSTRRQADEAFEALVSVGATILGLVVNDVVRHANGRSYQYYQYAEARGSRRWEPAGVRTGAHHGNGNGNGNGSGEIKQLPGTIIETDATFDVDRE